MFLNEVKHIVDDYLKDFLKDSSIQRTTAVSKGFLLPEVDCLQYVEFVGSAHFSARSTSEVLQIINNLKPVGLCIELCQYRYEYILSMCDYCLEKNFCSKKCEFVATIKTLKREKMNLDFWLIDMIQDEIMARILARASSEEAKAWQRLQKYVEQREAYGMRLWEEGLKDESMLLFNGDLELMRKNFPTLWRVLILERNALMACRLIYLVSQYLGRGFKSFKIVAFVGAAHVGGIQMLLKQPGNAYQLLEQFGIAFSPPYFIRKD
ncbi:MAG: hypothetical protein QG670_1071 [Thermoproteota archaeon]|nr:hypothetical protein [Thermoproteota archaeon]